MESSENKGMTTEEEGKAFYTDAKKYWEDIPPTVDGMLGGFSHISSTDIGGSNKFIRPFIKGANAKTGTSHVLDCGAGIGRITKLLLSTLFDKVDMVEINQTFLDNARQYIGERANKVDRLICSGLQEFTPETQRYDVIWCQWVLGHLTDSDLLSFFQRCKTGLKENGLIIVKENLVSGAKSDFDRNDSSYTRPRDLLVSLIKQSGLNIIKEEKQKNFPKEIYEVRMFALQ